MSEILLIVSVYSLSKMSLGKKLRARIEGKQTKRMTLKLIKWMQKKHLLKNKLRCTLCHHKMKMVSVMKRDQYVWYVIWRDNHHVSEWNNITLVL